MNFVFHIFCHDSYLDSFFPFCDLDSLLERLKFISDVHCIPLSDLTVELDDLG